MDSRRYKNIVYNHLRESKAVSLKILLEEEGEEKSDDIFDMPEEESESEGSSEDSSEEPESDKESDDSLSNDVEDSSEDSDADFVAVEKLKSDIQRLKDLTDLRLGTMDASDNKAIRSITDSFNYKNRMKDFMFLNEEKDANEIVKDLEGALEKNEDLIGHIEKQKAKAEAGTSIDVGNEVQKAIDKLIHFREKVDIVDLVEELFVQKIRLLAPAEDIVNNVSEFKELYRDEVHKNRAKIDLPGSKHYNDESVYLDKHDGYNGAAGARSQG